MTLLDAAYWVLCVVLVLSGVAKLAEPSATQATLTGIGLPSPSGSGRLIGAVEIFLGAAGLLATGGEIASIVAVMVAVVYLGFAGIVLAARRAGLDDCGCVGVRSRRPSGAHLLVNLGSAAIAAAAAVLGPVGLTDGLGSLSSVWAVVVGIAVAVVAAAMVALPAD